MDKTFIVIILQQKADMLPFSYILVVSQGHFLSYLFL